MMATHGEQLGNGGRIGGPKGGATGAGGQAREEQFKAGVTAERPAKVVSGGN